MKTRLAVHYPAGRGRIVMRTESDWDTDIEPIEVSADGTRHEFVIESEEDLIECKPCLYDGDELLWTPGPNAFVPLGTEIPFDSYPIFFSEAVGAVSDLLEIPSALDTHRRVRIYLPPGYDENELARYPAIYMQDGANLFLPSEAFQGTEWQIDETMDLLAEMRLIEHAIVVGIHTQARMEEFTDPGYKSYGAAIKEEVKPWIDTHYRTLPGPEDTSAVGSSLGGVVSFYLGWEWPEVFGNVACLSSTFTYRDDLVERVRHEPLGARSKLKIYLDSGWPQDNYEATLTMVATLLGRGFVFGRDLIHCAFPNDRHREQDWGGRCHLPIQFFCGHPRRLSAALRRARG